ncbi:hypothetical protein [Bacillus thuringiensis]|uniref:AbiTii domain-containing protein n=1 Tax=Bacillus thuringiensis TaxID=1428 RepID=UPI00159C4233|nr:hypothetical protein [Bacillus thuringiensis]
MTGSLVRDLQQKAMNPNIKITDLLRHSYSVARKLGIQEFESWIFSELNGYETNDTIPKYREIQVEIKVFNPHSGWIPVSLTEIDETMAREIKMHKINHPISELVSILENGEKSTVFEMAFSPEFELALQRTFQVDFHFSRILQKYQIARILDSVKDSVLKWSLDLEANNVLGNNLTFTPEEKQKAHQVINNNTYHISNSTISNSQLQQGVNNSQQNLNINTQEITSFLEELKNNLDQLRLDEEKEKVLKAHIQTLDSQVTLDPPNKTILKESLSTIRNVLEGITGSLIASSLWENASHLLQNLF